VGEVKRRGWEWKLLFFKVQEKGLKTKKGMKIKKKERDNEPTLAPK
jgi:hypothetical protein